MFISYVANKNSSKLTMLLRPTIGLAMLLATILIIRNETLKLKLLCVLRLSLGHSWRTRMAIRHRVLLIMTFAWSLALGGRGSVVTVEVEKHVHKEEQQEGDAVEDENVGNMSDARITQQLHLLLRCAHEQEPTGVQQERRQELEAIDFFVDVVRILRDDLIAKYEGNLNEPSEACRHKCVAKDRMHVCAE